jgi:hypothetical protein
MVTLRVRGRRSAHNERKEARVRSLPGSADHGREDASLSFLAPSRWALSGLTQLSLMNGRQDPYRVAGRQCASAGPDSTPSSTPGAVVTNLLATRLVGPEPGGAWTELTSAEHEPYLFEFDCEGPPSRTTGSLAGVQGGNVNVQSLSSTTTFVTGEGEQALDTELSENGGASWSGPEHSSVVGVAENTAAEATEIKPTFWSSLE